MSAYHHKVPKSPQVPVSSALSLGPGLQYKHELPPVEWASEPDIIGVSHNSSDMIVPEGTSCPASWYCSIQCSQLRRALADFSPPAAYIATSLRKTRQHGESFQPMLAVVFFCLQPRCGVSINKVLPSALVDSQGQYKDLYIATGSETPGGKSRKYSLMASHKWGLWYTENKSDNWKRHSWNENALHSKDTW